MISCMEEAVNLFPLSLLGSLPAQQPIIQCGKSGGVHCLEWRGSDVESRPCHQCHAEWKPLGYY